VTVSDAQYAIEALADTPVGRTASTALPRLGLVSNPEHRDNSAEVGQAWSVAIERLRAAGATTVDVELPDWSDSNRTAVDLQGPEAVANHAGRSTEAYQADVQERLREAAEVPAWRYAQARSEAAALTAAVGVLLSQVDALLLPTVPTVAPPIDAVADLSGSVAVRARLLRNTRLANLTGYPSLSLPLPTSGLPVGLQILAADNQAAWRAAAWIEQAL
jgi:aspartyl-tRNA(Asn)/glutamyl-tRNA(Gln) amidotransferase subunit A